MRVGSSRRFSERSAEVHTPELSRGSVPEPQDPVCEPRGEPRLPEVYAGTAIATALALLQARGSEEICILDETGQRSVVLSKRQMEQTLCTQAACRGLDAVQLGDLPIEEALSPWGKGVLASPRRRR